MAKFSPPIRKRTNIRTSLRVPATMLRRMDKSMEASGFKKKQRSLWLQGVIKDLLARSDCSNLVAEEFMMPGSTESIPLSLSDELAEAIAVAVARVETDERIKKDRSGLIRTAITQRLMANSGMQLSPKETVRPNPSINSDKESEE